MMKERYAKLLLGEDMSGSGKGVCTALAISNAITNLCGMLFSILIFNTRNETSLCVFFFLRVISLRSVMTHFCAFVYLLFI